MSTCLAAAVAAIWGAVVARRRLFGALLAKMLLHFGRQRALRQRLCQLRENALLAEQIAR